MKQLLLICAVVALVGCGKKDDPNTGVVNPNKSSPKAVPVNIADPIVEKAIRESLDIDGNNPTGELTKADLEKVTRLFLHNNQLADIPKGLEKLTQLNVLWLSDNKLTDVSDLEKLPKLEILHLEDNKLTDVTGLEKLTQLTGLDLNSNQLTELPKGLEKLTKLEELDLEANQLTDVKGLEKLDQLTFLNLESNKLTELPKDLEKLTQLEVLYLEFNRDLTKAQIDQLQKALPKCRISSNPTK